MNLLKRLRNLWRLSSAVVVDKEFKPDSITIKKAEGKEKPKMAEIIKRRDPIKEALEN